MENSTVTTEPIAEVAYTSDFHDYEKFKSRMNTRIGDWKSFKEKACTARKNRYLDVDIKKLRADGTLQPDETMIADRVIDANILREKADAMAFLNGSHRLCYFRCVDDPLVDTRQLESDITKGLTYNSWYKTFEKHFDGAALHGWDSIEVMFDTTKPLHIGFEHIGHEKLLFNPKLEDIQDDEFIMREYEISCLRLEEFKTKFRFDPQQVDLITRKNETSNHKKRDNEMFKIYKVYFKEEGKVFITWFAPDSQVNNYLKPIEPLISGAIAAPVSVAGNGNAAITSEGHIDSVATSIPTPAQPTQTFATMYPCFLYVAYDDEQESITTHRGRDFLDQPQQEARTAILSALVNGTTRSANVYASPDSDDPEAANKLEGITLENGVILPTKVNFYSQPAPDVGSLQVLQFMHTQNSQQQGKMAAAVSNRKDARKTSTELNLAAEEEQKITSTNLATYSEFLRLIFTYTWPIIQSRAVAGAIDLCKIQVPQQTQPMMMGQPPIPLPPVFVNDIALISKKYDVRPAGDIDVVQKQKQLAEMKQDWPVIQMIPGLNKIFIEDLIRLQYPQSADRYIAAMNAGDPGKQVATSLLNTLKGALQPEELNALTPQGQQQLQQVVTTAQQYIQAPT